MTETKRSAETNVDRLAQSAHEAVDKTASVASSYAERFSTKGEQLMQMQEDWMTTARDYVRDNPLQALGIAVAAGIVFAWGKGASWPIALGVAALVNLVAAGVLGWFTFKLAKELPFTALLRQLRGRDPEPPQ